MFKKVRREDKYIMCIVLFLLLGTGGVYKASAFCTV